MKSVLFFVLTFVLLSLPELSWAAGLVPCSGTECSACHFAQLGNNVFKWMVGVLFVVFGVVAAMGGIGLVTSGGKPDALSAAKSKLVNAVVGLLIVFAAWLLVDTIIRMLVSDSGEISSGKLWYSIECMTQTATESAPDEADYQAVIGSGVATPHGSSAAAGAGLSAADAKTGLTAAGIQVKDGAGLAGLRPHVITELQGLEADCKCNIVITEATGGTHQSGEFSHSNGFKADIRTNDNPTLLNYVKTLEPAGKWKDGTPVYYDANSCASYAIESDHIDVVYKTGCK